jgi:hypothetical protein
MAISRRSIERSYQEFDNGSNEQYNLAYKRVKRIKVFYVHVLVYVFVNLSYIFEF